MKFVDLSTHIFPSVYLKKLPNSPSEILGMGKQFYDVDLRLKLMDRYKIDRQVISLSSQGLAADDRNFIELVRSGNDGIAEIVHQHPNRFVGLSTLNHLESPAIMEELERSVSELGMRGVMIHTNQHGKPLDSPEFDDFFSSVEKLNVPVLIHPRSWDYYPWIRKHRLDMILGWPFETSLAISRLIFSGFFDRHKKIRIVTHHAGGMLPFFAKRIEGVYEQGLAYPSMTLESSASKSPIEYLSRLYYDTAVYGSAEALRCTLSFSGVDRLVFGTDYPFGPEAGEAYVRDTIASVKQLGVAVSDEERIFHSNAADLLKL